MIEERALVTSRDGEFANIETRRTTACGHCQVESACSTSLLSKYFGYRNLSVRALNPIDACPGDEVIVGLHECPDGCFRQLLPVADLVVDRVCGIRSVVGGRIKFCRYGTGISVRRSIGSINRVGMGAPQRAQAQPGQSVSGSDLKAREPA